MTMGRWTNGKGISREDKEADQTPGWMNSCDVDENRESEMEYEMRGVSEAVMRR